MDYLAIKHIFPILALTMVIYALLFDFKKEIKNKEGCVVKKTLNMHGWINIIMLLIIGLGTLICSINEEIKADQKNQRIIDLTEENSELTKRALEQISDGNTYAYISNNYGCNTGIKGDTIKFIIKIVSEIPIYDLVINLYEI